MDSDNPVFFAGKMLLRIAELRPPVFLQKHLMHKALSRSFRIPVNHICSFAKIIFILFPKALEVLKTVFKRFT